MQKLRRDLDHARAKQSAAGASVQHVVVGFDVIELLYAVIAAQDIELRKLRGQQSAGESAAASPSMAAIDPGADAYVGHIENPGDSAVYHLKKPKPAQQAEDHIDVQS
jgi:hypothetical protein